MSFGETIFLFFLALIIFGPKKLPEIARTVGKYLNEFRRASNEFKAQIEQEIAHLETPKILPPTLASASFAGDRHVTEGLAPEGTASRTLIGDSATGETAVSGDASATETTATDPASQLATATLAAPLSEEQIGVPVADAGATDSEAPTAEMSPVREAAEDSVKTPAPQEFHA
ncbi:MAG TPA: twin-arginine translocase TatA/TatE family subunit [Candidatus Sulfotelmatobacter sp.]